MSGIAARSLGWIGGARAYLLVGAGCFLAGAVAGSQATSLSSNARIARLQRDHAEAEAQAVNAALARVQRQGRITADAGARAADNQTRIEIRYRTLSEKVPVYVTPKADSDVRVPLGAVVLLDAAARGSDPDGVSFAAGKSHDSPSDVTLSRLVAGVVENYGLANANAQQLSDLQGWVRSQETTPP